jgi:hypothetical protein
MFASTRANEVDAFADFAAARDISFNALDRA